MIEEVSSSSVCVCVYVGFLKHGVHICCWIQNKSEIWKDKKTTQLNDS